MTFDQFIELVTLFLGTFATLLSLWLRYRLIEQGKDVSELKAQVRSQSEPPR